MLNCLDTKDSMTLNTCQGNSVKQEGNKNQANIYMCINMYNLPTHGQSQHTAHMCSMKQSHNTERKKWCTLLHITF